MRKPCDSCRFYLTCTTRRACAAWLWWFAARWRELTERWAEASIEEDSEFGEWWE